MKTYSGIGVMTGTSLDGIDLAYCGFSESNGQWQFKINASASVPMDPKWKDRLLLLDEQSAEIYAKTHVYFAHYLGQNIKAFIDRENLKPDFVACHGQTIFHQPEKGFTAQIGDGETLVSFLDCPLVTNFRNKDVALGGQGAPLVPFGEQMLLGGERAYLNLGGIANLSWKETAFDVCVCNMALNWLAMDFDQSLNYDKDGHLATQGKIYPPLLDRLRDLDYYQQKPPKSLGTEWFRKHLLPYLAAEELTIEDRSATYIQHIAEEVAKATSKTVPQGRKILITGGGAHHPVLMKALELELAKSGYSIDKDEDPQLIDFKEAVIFAFLGLNALLGRPNILNSATGARLACAGGSIHLPAKGGLPLL